MTNSEKVKKVLFEYPTLRAHVKNKDKYLERLEENLRKERSKDILRFGGDTPGLDKEERINIEMDQRRVEFERTAIYLDYLDMCFNTVKDIEIAIYGDSDYFKIIEKKYFEHLPLERVASDLHYSDSNVKHHHRRLLKVICTAIFGKAPI